MIQKLKYQIFSTPDKEPDEPGSSLEIAIIHTASMMNEATREIQVPSLTVLRDRVKKSLINFSGAEGALRKKVVDNFMQEFADKPVSMFQARERWHEIVQDIFGDPQDYNDPLFIAKQGFLGSGFQNVWNFLSAPED